MLDTLRDARAMGKRRVGLVSAFRSCGRMAVFDVAGVASREFFLARACALATEGTARIKNDKRTMWTIRLTPRVWLIGDQPPLLLVSDAGDSEELRRFTVAGI